MGEQSASLDQVATFRAHLTAQRDNALVAWRTTISGDYKTAAHTGYALLTQILADFDRAFTPPNAPTQPD